MASRHHSLETGDVEDVAELIANFEQHAGIKVAVAVSLEGKGKNRSLFLTATAFHIVPMVGEALPLVSVSATCSAMRVKTLTGALTQLMYRLDGALAELEMGGGSPAA